MPKFWASWIGSLLWQKHKVCANPATKWCNCKIIMTNDKNMCARENIGGRKYAAKKASVCTWCSFWPLLNTQWIFNLAYKMYVTPNMPFFGPRHRPLSILWTFLKWYIIMIEKKLLLLFIIHYDIYTSPFTVVCNDIQAKCMQVQQQNVIIIIGVI